MKQFCLLFLVLALLTGAIKADTNDLRAQIGSTFSAPILHEGQYYFVATTGALYEASKDFKTAKKIYEGQKQTLGNVTLFENRLYWGDGLHTDQKSFLHVFDLKTKMLVKAIPVDGHVERAPLCHEGLIYVPLGPAGLMALNIQDFKKKWQIKDFKGKKIHVDSNLVAVGEKICGTTVYETKGVICIEKKTGKITQMSQLSRDPKSEITVWKDHVVGFSTEGDLIKPKWVIPADLYVYDVKNDKMKMSKELRGYNFFAPHIIGDEAFVTLSTGDFILVNLNDGKISFLGEFPEPFINNSFMVGKNYCAIGIMGKYLCYSKTQAGYAISTDKRLMETIIGKITVQNNNLIAPSRVGYYLE